MRRVFAQRQNCWKYKTKKERNKSEVNIPYHNKEEITEDVLLGYGDVDGVLNSNGYFNSIVGRVANRIGGAQFSLGDKNYKLFSNTPPNHLHGGKTGFNKKIWKIANIE